MSVCGVTSLTSGQLCHVVEMLLILESSSACGLVIDLCGGVFKGCLRGGPPHALLLSVARTVLRNGTLELPEEAQLKIVAQGCRLEGITVRGPGITFPRGMSAAGPQLVAFTVTVSVFDDPCLLRVYSMFLD